MTTGPSGVPKVTDSRPGVPRGATNSNEMTVEVLLGGQAEPLGHALRVAADGQRLDAHLGVGTGRRVDGGIGPLHVVGQLRVGHQALDADLAPPQLDPVGAVAVAVDGATTEALLDRREVVDLDDPAEPAAADLGAVP